MALVVPTMIITITATIPAGFSSRRTMAGSGFVSAATRIGVTEPVWFGLSPRWVKVKNPNAPAVKRKAEEVWGR